LQIPADRRGSKFFPRIADDSGISMKRSLDEFKYRRQLATNRREYGVAHRRLRRRFAADVAAGTAKCAHCGELIEPGSLWDLAHDDADRRLYLGPSHAGCNRGELHRNKSRASGEPVRSGPLVGR
jgi:hypothetical protein